MRQLRDDTHVIVDGEVRVYRRERSLNAAGSGANGHYAHGPRAAHTYMRILNFDFRNKSSIHLDNLELRHSVSQRETFSLHSKQGSFRPPISVGTRRCKPDLATKHLLGGTP